MGNTIPEERPSHSFDGCLVDELGCSIATDEFPEIPCVEVRRSIYQHDDGFTKLVSECTKE